MRFLRVGLQASVVLRCMLAAPRVPTDRFKGGVRGAGRASPAPRSWKRRAARSRRVVRRSLQRADNVHGNASVLQLSAGAALPRQELGRSCPVALQKPRGCRAQHPFGLEAVAAPPLHAVAGAAPAGVRPAAARPLSGCCGRSPAATAHGRTTPIQNLRKTLAFAAICISMFLHSFCSAEKRLTTRTRTCRGRAPETSTYHRTRKVAPLLCGRFLADNPKNRSRLAVHDFAY